MTADRRGIDVFVGSMSGGISTMIVLTMMGCVVRLRRVSLGYRYQEGERKRHRHYGEQSGQQQYLMISGHAFAHFPRYFTNSILNLPVAVGSMKNTKGLIGARPRQ